VDNFSHRCIFPLPVSPSLHTFHHCPPFFSAHYTLRPLWSDLAHFVRIMLALRRRLLLAISRCYVLSLLSDAFTVSLSLSLVSMDNYIAVFDCDTIGCMCARLVFNLEATLGAKCAPKIQDQDQPRMS